MKTKETLQLELNLFNYLQKLGNFCVFECQLGIYKGGRVDCLSINTKNIIKCYEIKVSKEDFHSNHGHNFEGNFNYYVMPVELYKEIKDEIPSDIGVLVPLNRTLKSVKKSLRKVSRYSPDDIRNYMMRSLYYKYQKYFPQSQKKLLVL